jgi:hypothetical protein
MTEERHAAFKKAREYIGEVAAAKLLGHERELLDHAAEDLLLAGSLEEAQAAHRSAAVMLETLVESGRWTQTMSDQLLVLLDACGPQQLLIGA